MFVLILFKRPASTATSPYRTILFVTGLKKNYRCIFRYFKHHYEELRIKRYFFKNNSVTDDISVPLLSIPRA